MPRPKSADGRRASQRTSRLSNSGAISRSKIARCSSSERGGEQCGEPLAVEPGERVAGADEAAEQPVPIEAARESSMRRRPSRSRPSQ